MMPVDRVDLAKVRGRTLVLTLAITVVAALIAYGLTLLLYLPAPPEECKDALQWGSGGGGFACEHPGHRIDAQLGVTICRCQADQQAQEEI